MQIEFGTHSTSYSTDSNANLCFAAGIIRGDASFSLHYKDPDDFLPIDTICMLLTICDCGGCKWQTEVKFTTEILIARMVNVIRGADNAPTRVTESMRNFAGDPILTDIRYSTDARNYRTLNIDGDLFDIPFKYTGVSMDLFDLHPYSTPFPMLATLSVRVNSGFFLM